LIIGSFSKGREGRGFIELCLLHIKPPLTPPCKGGEHDNLFFSSKHLSQVIILILSTTPFPLLKKKGVFEQTPTVSLLAKHLPLPLPAKAEQESWTTSAG